MNEPTILGIDNGNTGGVVAISRVPGIPPIKMFPMPTRKYTRPGNPASKNKKAKIDKNWLEIDPDELSDRLSRIDQPEKMVAIFEECPDHADMASIMRSMAMSSGVIIAVLTLLRIRVVRVLPREWQPAMLGSEIPKGETKQRAEETAGYLWPTERWRASSRCSTPHTGLIDAALIAEFGRRRGL